MISIIIPAYNEEKRIGRTLEEYGRFFSDKKRNKEIKNFEILVVINGTQDKTEEIVKEFSKKYSEIKYLNFKRDGKGFAIIEGFKDALKRESQLIGFVDADMATPPNAFYDLIKNIGNCQGVIANRLDKRSKIGSRSFLREVLSRGFNLIVRILFLFNYRDTQCGAKLFKRELIREIAPKLGSSEWSFDVDLLFYARREKARIKSIPTMWIDKRGSSINFKKIPLTMLLSVIRLRLIHSPFNLIVRFYRMLPKRLKFH